MRFEDGVGKMGKGTTYVRNENMGHHKKLLHKNTVIYRCEMNQAIYS